MVKKNVIGKSSISVLEKYISGLFVHVLSKLIRVVCKLYLISAILWGLENAILFVLNTKAILLPGFLNRLDECVILSLNK